MLSRSSKAADLTVPARRRLLSDLKRLEEEPLPLASARPCGDEDLSLWHGVIGVEMDVTHLDRVTVPLHFLIDFPGNYPQSAPNIGFSFDFEYRGGAQYVMPDGRLKGKKVICLDVLGNFQHVHTEWKHEVGTGWSPAYTVTTLLVQLQSVLCDLGSKMSQRERDVTYQSAVRFCEKNPSAVLELLDEDDIKERREQRATACRLDRICGGSETLAARARAFAATAGFAADAAKMKAFLTLLSDVSSSAAGSEAGGSTRSGDTPRRPEVDRNICCFATGKLYTETMLGVGVSRERRNLGTAGELLSKEAYDGGLRQSTNKSAFEFFLPVWINEAHSAGSPAWRDALMRSCLEIGRAMFEIRSVDKAGEDSAVLEVYPRLINQMIVEMMKPDAGKSEAIATFEALCNFWRTLRWLVDTRPTLRNRIGELLTNFVADEGFRHKDKTPDLGMVLVLFTALQGHSGCPSREAFIKAYSDENPLRWVMWWQRSGTQPEGAAVFEATRVSREICMFQMMVVDVIIGDARETLPAMEATNCKLPDRLERLQKEWRERKSTTDGWAAYFKAIGAPRPAFGSTGEWIAECIRRAAAKGPKYGGAKGEGKGAKGEGKGSKGEGKAGKGGKGGKGGAKGKWA